jgi:hypothetical protein
MLYVAVNGRIPVNEETIVAYLMEFSRRGRRKKHYNPQ